MITRDDAAGSVSQIIINDGAMTNTNPTNGSAAQMDNWLGNLVIPSTVLGMRHFTVMGDAQDLEERLFFVSEQLGMNNPFGGPEELIDSRVDTSGETLPADAVALLTQVLGPFGAAERDCLAWMVNGVEISGTDGAGGASTTATGVGGSANSSSASSSSSGAPTSGSGGGGSGGTGAGTNLQGYGVERGDGCQCNNGLPRDANSWYLLLVALGVTVGARRSRS